MSKNELSRRNFLRLMASGVAAAVAAQAGVLPTPVRAQGGKFQEAPMLKKLVDAGTLPPIDQRIPKNPHVVTPLEKVGNYGGTWHRAFKGISDRFGMSKLHEEMAIKWDAPTADTVGLVANYIEKWTQNDNATEFTFTLREGLKWSDGHDFTTDDVKFYYDQCYIGKLLQKKGYYTIKDKDGKPVDMKLTVVDKLTWTVAFPVPNPLLVINIAKDTGGIITGPTMAAPAHYLKDYIPELTSDQSKIDAAMKAADVKTWQELWGAAGNGEGTVLFWYRNPAVPTITAWRSVNTPDKDPYIMERNPYYHAVDTEGNQLPYIDQIENALFSDAAVYDLWVTQGKIDMDDRFVNPANFTLYKENEAKGDYRVLSWISAYTNAFFPNISHKDPAMRAIFDNADFRQAISIAINRQEINDLIYNGILNPRQASPVHGSPNYDAEFEAKWAEYDPEAAKALLDKMGMDKKDAQGYRLRPDGQPFSFKILHWFTTGESETDEIGQVVKYWQAIGLNVIQDPVERGLYGTRTQAGDVDMGYYRADRNSVVMADPQRYTAQNDDGPWAPLYGHWYTQQATGMSNLLTEEPPKDHPIRKVWELWDQTQKEADEAKRNALFKQLLDIHKEHPYMIGTLGEAPRPIIVSNKMFNVPDKRIWDDITRSLGYTNPMQYSFKA
jgi:peptide/nickel transport system substrate-binding protein